jgi:hypothetical protein
VARLTPSIGFASATTESCTTSLPTTVLSSSSASSTAATLNAGSEPADPPVTIFDPYTPAATVRTLLRRHAYARPGNDRVSFVSARERLVTMPNDEKPGCSATEDVIVVEGLLHALRNDGSGRRHEPQIATRVAGAAHLQRGVMSPPRSAEPGPGLMSMSMPSRLSRGLMEPAPNTSPFDWSRDGIASLWLIALMLRLDSSHAAPPAEWARP